jgi:acetyl-CoA carboxylase biotin carboxyl carrier protein
MSDQNPHNPSRDESRQSRRYQDRRSSRLQKRPPSQDRQDQSKQAEPSLNLGELRELIELMSKNNLTDFELEREGFRVRLRRNFGTTTPISISHAQEETGLSSQSPSSPTSIPPVIQSSAPLSTEPNKAAEEDLHIITAPIVGTFYRSPSPTAEPFIRVGSNVDPETVVCIIEAMKLMNEIQAEVSGEVVKIFVENGQPVEYGQPLFGVKR